MTADFGRGFTVTNLSYMRQFYLTFPNYHALRDELSWTHYRLLIKVANEKARQFYLEECVKSAWSTRQLERQINSFTEIPFGIGKRIFFCGQAKAIYFRWGAFFY